MNMKVKPFKPKTQAEKHLVLLIKAIFERIASYGFSEWHEWAHKIGEKSRCPNSSPFIGFVREWDRNQNEKTKASLTQINVLDFHVKRGILTTEVNPWA